MITSIFEKPWLLLTVAAVLLVVAGVVCQIRPRWKRWPYLVPLLVAALAFGLDRLVETDAEQIQSILTACRQHALAGTIRQIDPLVSEAYIDPAHSTKEAMLRSAEAAIQRACLQRVVERQHTLSITGDTAVSQVRFRVHLDTQQSQYAMAGSLLFVTLEIHYAREADGQWRIRRVLLVSVNDQPMGWKNI